MGNTVEKAVLNTYNGKLSIKFTDPVDEGDLSNVSVNGDFLSDISSSYPGYISGQEYIMAADWLEGYFETSSTETISVTQNSTNTYTSTYYHTWTTTSVTGN